MAIKEKLYWFLFDTRKKYEGYAVVPKYFRYQYQIELWREIKMFLRSIARVFAFTHIRFVVYDFFRIASLKEEESKYGTKGYDYWKISDIGFKEDDSLMIVSAMRSALYVYYYNSDRTTLRHVMVRLRLRRYSGTILKLIQKEITTRYRDVESRNVRVNLLSTLYFFIDNPIYCNYIKFYNTRRYVLGYSKSV